MLRFFLFFLFIFLLVIKAPAQSTKDTLIPLPTDSNTSVRDSLIGDSTQGSLPIAVIVSDSVSKRPLFSGVAWHVLPGVSLGEQILQRHPYFNFHSRPIAVLPDVKIFKGKEVMFYSLIAIVLIFALLKLAFSKYFNDLFRVFFRTTMKQRQIREQLMQTPLPSLVFNVFFIASTGLYIDFMFQYFNFMPVPNFWVLYLYCCVGLAVIYLIKFIGLKICGWLFNMKQAADSYIFIVFIINKVIGIFLLPFLVLLGFMDGLWYAVALVISWAGIGALLLYRLILGFSAVRNEVKFNLFHFFLYLVAFEVAPLLLIYRLLLLVF
ncbi:MAG TPA: DUF4271 domain-containing protein [Chryseolinea sp.]|nr:DUF4271 domain-containing protein [Chryseolinea sp.]